MYRNFFIGVYILPVDHGIMCIGTTIRILVEFVFKMLRGKTMSGHLPTPKLFSLFLYFFFYKMFKTFKNTFKPKKPIVLYY